ncbi:MAG: carbamoyltransferase C-terminal domain-containing protein, partial [Elusimicrobiota bacterium]
KDFGTAFGAAAMAWLKRRGVPAREEWRHAFLGAPDKAGAAELALAARGLKGEAPGPRELIEKTADLLASEKIVAWYEGAMEVGPRALGHRSLLADPRSDAMKHRLNERIKHRQPFRPYGPLLREEDADRFFEIPEAARLPCRFMLAAVRARAQAYERIPAALHADGTARPQLVYKEYSPRYWKLINRFREKTSIPMVLNTSFNLRGE